MPNFRLCAPLTQERLSVTVQSLSVPKKGYRDSKLNPGAFAIVPPEVFPPTVAFSFVKPPKVTFGIRSFLLTCFDWAPPLVGSGKRTGRTVGPRPSAARLLLSRAA